MQPVGLVFLSFQCFACWGFEFQCNLEMLSMDGSDSIFCCILGKCGTGQPFFYWDFFLKLYSVLCQHWSWWFLYLLSYRGRKKTKAVNNIFQEYFRFWCRKLKNSFINEEVLPQWYKPVENLDWFELVFFTANIHLQKLLCFANFT